MLKITFGVRIIGINNQRVPEVIFCEWTAMWCFGS
jgi:hypothetical protein